MACACEVVVAVHTENEAQQLAKIAIDEVKRIEAKFSRYLTDSIVARVNKAAGLDAVECDEETWSLLEFSDALHKSSDGLFDITSGVLRRVWNFRAAKVPSERELQEVLPLIGWGKVERTNHTVRLPKVGMELDFGGFGKEYAADRAGALLEKNGLLHGYVNLAGDIRVVGPKPDASPWMFGIQDPRNKDRILATIPVERGGLATSGDYERFFEVNAQRYCHVLNPLSGMPVTYWRTVSVVAPLAVLAGNCTTIAMLKESEALTFLKSTGLNYLAVDQSGVIHVQQTSEIALD
jgi:thiamine biosynthesis lipoprotein